MNDLRHRTSYGVYEETLISSAQHDHSQKLYIDGAIAPRDPQIYSRLRELSLQNCSCALTYSQFLRILSDCVHLRALSLGSFLGKLAPDTHRTTRERIPLLQLSQITLAYHPPSQSDTFIGDLVQRTSPRQSYRDRVPCRRYLDKYPARTPTRNPHHTYTSPGADQQGRADRIQSYLQIDCHWDPSIGSRPPYNPSTRALRCTTSSCGAFLAFTLFLLRCLLCYGRPLLALL